MIKKIAALRTTECAESRYSMGLSIQNGAKERVYPPLLAFVNIKMLFSNEI